MKKRELYLKDKIVLVFFVIFGLVLLAINALTNASQHFSYLASSFLAGKFYFLDFSGSWSDTTLFGGHHFWPLGPFPALALMPFVLMSKLFNTFYFQGYLNIFIVAATLFLAYKLAGKFLFSKMDSVFLTFAFIFSSVYLGIAFIPISWWLSHAIVVLLLMLFLWEYFNQKRRNFLILLIGLTLATRVTAGIGPLVFLFLDIVWSENSWREKLVEISRAVFNSPLLPIILLLFIYNFLRFGSFFEFGYNWQIQGLDALEKARSYGTFSLTHLPGNLYYAFLASPVPVFKDGLSHVLTYPFIKPDTWGLSLFFTSPWLLYFFFFKYKSKLSKMLWIAAVATAIPVFLYFGIGVNQFGFRYALDFFPFIYVLFLHAYSQKNSQLSEKLKTLFIVSAVVNMYLFLIMLSAW